MSMLPWQHNVLPKWTTFYTATIIKLVTKQVIKSLAFSVLGGWGFIGLFPLFVFGSFNYLWLFLLFLYLSKNTIKNLFCLSCRNKQTEIDSPPPAKSSSQDLLRVAVVSVPKVLHPISSFTSADCSQKEDILYLSQHYLKHRDTSLSELLTYQDPAQHAVSGTLGHIKWHWMP